MKLLIIHPSPQFAGSGFYLQVVAEHFVQHGHQVLVACEGKIKYPFLNRVQWINIQLENGLCCQDFLNRLIDFKADFIIQVGVRNQPMKAALQLIAKQPVPMIVQAEDDEYLPFLKHSPYQTTQILETLNYPNPSWCDYAKFISQLNFKFSLNNLVGVNGNRWVDPILRILCYRLASCYGAIWYDMGERLHGWFEKPYFVLPPVIKASDYLDYQYDSGNRVKFLELYNIDPASKVIFISGTVYDYSDEFDCFLRALQLVCEQVDQPLTLVTTGRGKVGQGLNNAVFNFKWVSMNAPDERDYMLMNLYSDINAAPGFADSFNEYRMSSRLVKSLILGRPILTFQTGFARRIEHENYCFCTTTNSYEEWAQVIKNALTQSAPGFNFRAYEYAYKNFAIESVGVQIDKQIANVKETQPLRGMKLLMLRASIWILQLFSKFLPSMKQLQNDESIYIDKILHKLAVNKANKIAIYGAGELGDKLGAQIKSLMPDIEIKFYVDQRAEKETFNISGIQVIGPSLLTSKSDDIDCLLIASVAFHDKIIKNIKEQRLINDTVKVISG
ncbi:nucleoside-diphosphate sugar epimerase/dehydratase [Gayadomonas joobiniege]|uniref:nucleoside-diphosphate sugar epimerase/dehydratase n=1 Tax=Gayadomonas joobiniege TaxID=1234606 RepID=UPI00036EC568|nr:hypothetical protein [Gayadomonas joobiniege]